MIKYELCKCEFEDHMNESGFSREVVDKIYDILEDDEVDFDLQYFRDRFEEYDSKDECKYIANLTEYEYVAAKNNKAIFELENGSVLLDNEML